VFLAIEEDTMQHGCVWKCYRTYSIMEVKFLAYVLNVTNRSVMHIISYANVYFIAYVYNNCVDCSNKWSVDTDVTP